MATTINKYKGLEVTVAKLKIEDEHVDQQIQSLLAQNPVKEAKEGPVENGDVTVIDFEGFKDGVPFQGGKGTGYELGIGSHSFIPGFEEQMIGMQKGETRDLNLTFPENYGAAELAGADVVFTVTVHEIYNQKEAELTDAFAAGLGQNGIDSVDSLKAYIRRHLEVEAERQASNSAEEAIIRALVEGTETEVTEEAVAEATAAQLEQVKMSLMQQGVSYEQYLQMTGMTEEILKGKLRESAVAQVKLQAALMEIAALEALEVTEEDLDDYYGQIAQTYYTDKETVKAQVPEAVLRKDISCRKANDLVMDAAIIHYEE